MILAITITAALWLVVGAVSVAAYIARRTRRITTRDALQVAACAVAGPIALALLASSIIEEHPARWLDRTILDLGRKP